MWQVVGSLIPPPPSKEPSLDFAKVLLGGSDGLAAQSMVFQRNSCFSTISSEGL